MSTVIHQWEASRLGFWFGVLGSGIAWLVHLILASLIAEFGCVAGWGHTTWIGLTPVAWMILVMSIVTLAAAVLATLVALRNERRFHPGGFEDSGEQNPFYYLARVGKIAGVLFTITILVQTLPILFYLRHC